MTGHGDKGKELSRLLDEESSPQRIPGRKSPPAPPDDRPGAGMSLGELFKERIGEATTGMRDHEPSVAPGNDDFLRKDATKKDKARDDYTRVTTLSYDEVDPS